MIELIVFVVAVGLVVWLLGLLPIPAPFQQIVMVIGILVVVVRVLQAFGLIGALPTLR